MLKRPLPTLAFLLAIALPSAAFAGHWSNNTVPNGIFRSTDTTGRYDLGIDITQAGSTPENVANFLAGLPPRIHEIIVTACHDRVSHPAGHQPSIVSFCQTVVSL